MRIQTFPDSFEFSGSYHDIRIQIGNAVPPKLAYEIAKQLLKMF
jgi:DNA (cytosine-5)-methyltransferase 1